MQKAKEAKIASDESKKKRTSAIEEYGQNADEAAIEKRVREEVKAEMMTYLSCIICTEPVDGPYVLSCGHWFCFRCKPAVGDTLKQCAECRRMITKEPYQIFQIQKLLNYLTGNDLSFTSQAESTRRQLRTFTQREDEFKLINDLVSSWRSSKDRDSPAYTPLNGMNITVSLKEWIEKFKP